MHELLLFQDDRFLRRVPLGRGPLLVGRGSDVDLVLEGTGVSRHHARLRPAEGGWRVEDAGSTNGLKLDGQVVQSARVSVGSALEIGPFRLYLAPAPDPGEARTEGAVEALFVASARVGEAEDPEALLAEMLDAAMQVFEAERGLILVHGREDDWSPAISRAIDLEAQEGQASQTVAREVARRGEPVLLSDSHTDDDFGSAPSIEASDARTILCAPLQVEGAVEAVVYLDGPAQRRLYTDRDLRLLATFATHAAAAWQGARRRRAAEARARNLRALQRDAARDAGRDPTRLVRASAAMRSLYQQVEAVAARDTTTLILGESGTGKELLARAIHDLSPRRDGPFVAVNCMALVADLAVAELFGHEKGAYTGADSARPGRFELADGGTLFLDEVGELSLEMQVRLLRVLQERSFERVGGARTLQLDVRVVAATNRDMRQAVREGSFREDLWYRLNVFPLEVPPLRARVEDVPALAARFVEDFAVAFRRDIEGLEPEVIDALKRYSWPGNVRELRNVIERAFVLEPSPRISLASLPADLRSAAAPASPGGAPAAAGAAAWPADFHAAREQFELAFLTRALRKHRGNMTAAGDEAGIPRKTIYRKLKALGTSVEEILAGDDA